MLCRIGRKLVESESKSLSRRRLQRNIRTLESDFVAGAIGRELFAHQRAEIGAYSSANRTTTYAPAIAP